jgi:hypothetical protein
VHNTLLLTAFALNAMPHSHDNMATGRTNGQVRRHFIYFIGYHHEVDQNKREMRNEFYSQPPTKFFNIF